jgi:hypothetical protein
MAISQQQLLENVNGRPDRPEELGRTATQAVLTRTRGPGGLTDEESC